MKPTASLALFSFFLLVAFTTASELVFDSDGDIMRNGGKYNLSPQEGNAADGVVMAGVIFKEATGWECSVAVVQSLNLNTGWIIDISSTINLPYITTTMPLFPSFDYLPPNICSNTSSWVVIRSPPIGEAVMAGNGREEFGDAFVSGWFNIKPYDSAKRFYKLVFCHENGECADIGSVQVEGRNIKRFVIIDGEPLVFKFVKSNSNRIVSHLSMVV